MLIKSVSNCTLNEFVEIELFEYLMLERFFGNPITRFVCFFQSFKQSGVLAFKWFEFDIYNQFNAFK